MQEDKIEFIAGLLAKKQDEALTARLEKNNDLYYKIQDDIEQLQQKYIRLNKQQHGSN
jgi:hypothetical protein